MIIKSQLKDAQLEVVDSSKDNLIGGISYNKTNSKIEISDGSSVKKVFDSMSKLEYNSIEVISDDYEITDNDNYVCINVNTGDTDRTITLPATTNNLNRVIYISKSDNDIGRVVVTPQAGEFIGNTLSGYSLLTLGENIILICNSGNWQIISAYKAGDVFKAMTALDVDWEQASIFSKTTDDDVTITFSNIVNNKTINVAMTDTNTKTITWPTYILWDNPDDVIDPIPVQTPLMTDIYEFKNINGVVYGKKSYANMAGDWPYGILGDLTVDLGDTLELPAGAIYDYDNVTINGTLRFTGSTTDFTILGIVGDLSGSGTIECKKSTVSGTSSIMTPDGQSISHTITQKNGGSGGVGASVKVTEGTDFTAAGGSRQTQSNGNGGAGGGGAIAGKWVTDRNVWISLDGGDYGQNGSKGNSGSGTSSTYGYAGSSISATSGSFGGYGSDGVVTTSSKNSDGGNGGTTRYVDSSRYGGGGGAAGAYYYGLTFIGGAAGGGGGAGARGYHGKNLYIRCKGTFDGTSLTIDVSAGNGGGGGVGGDADRYVPIFSGSSYLGVGAGGGGAGGAGGSAGKIVVRHAGAGVYTAATYVYTAGTKGTAGTAGTSLDGETYITISTAAANATAAQDGEVGVLDVAEYGA